MTNILIASPLEPEHVETITAVAPERIRVIYEPELLPVPRYVADHNGAPRALTPEQLGRWRGHLAAAEVMFDFDWLDPAALPRNAPRLRWLQATSAGIGEYLVQTGLAQSQIQFTTAAGVHGQPLAEFTILSLLYFIKDVPFLRRQQAEKRWERYTAQSLAGRRALVVGLGTIGREIARSLAALGVEVWGVRRTDDGPAPEGITRLVGQADLRPALAAVDALVVACPLTPATLGLIGRAEIAALPSHAVIVNVGRGLVIDEAAMTEALAAGRLAGAALDVFQEEPLPPESPLWSMPNVLVSPHSASTVGAENERIVAIFTDNLRRFLDGRPLRNRFEAERGY